MSANAEPQLRESFDYLVELAPEARESALAELALLHPELVEQLRKLLLSGKTSGATEDPIGGRVLRSLDSAPPAQGQQIGPYQLLRLLGAGGMGWVYLAERYADGVRQQVALKLVRGAGRAAADDLFQRERMVLASLHHPNIARFLDAGSADGRRYLVMEYVDGQTVQSWLEQHQPSLQQRLDLLIALAQAVDHAHANLVVHRDLKPANLLVRSDHSPVLLDFGIAKLIGTEASERITSTRVYTPTYAAPEQIAGRAVTVATDVHALGLMLFELLCGVPARGKDDAAPRTQASQVARSSELPWVRRDASGIKIELDRIVAMALREEPERRYRSAADLVADMKRWQRGLPVLAMPDSVVYRSRKWLRRHRWGVAVAAAALVATVFFIVQLQTALQRAQLAEREAERKAQTAQAVAELMTDLFEGADPRIARNAQLSARALLERGAERLGRHRSGDIGIDAQLRLTVGVLFAQIGDPDVAAAQFQAGLALAPSEPLLNAELLHEQARALSTLERNPEAEASARAALALRETHLGPNGAAVAHALQSLGVAVQKQGRGDEAEALFLRAQKIFAAQQPPDLEGLAAVRHNLGWIAQRRGELALASQQYQQAVDEKTALYGAEDPRTMVSMMPLAQTLAGIGEINSAIELLEQLVAGRRKVNGLDSLETGIASNELGVLKMLRGDLVEALALCQAAADIAARVAPESGEHARALNQLGTVQELRGDLVTAEDHYRRSLAVRRLTFGADDVYTLRAEHNLCRVLITREGAASAGACALTVYQRRNTVLGAANPETDDSRAMVEGLSAAPDRAWLVERFEHYRGLGSTHLTRNVRFATLLAAGKEPSADDFERLASLADALRKFHGEKSVNAALTELRLAQLARRLGRPELMASALARAERVLPAALAPMSLPLKELLELRALAGSDRRGQ